MTNPDNYPALQGKSSDRAPDILAVGQRAISTLYISMSERHPEGADASYVRWHTLDHRPEQYRIPSIRSALRVVSTPECRAARAASAPELDAVDHVMTYFFKDREGLVPFYDLAIALSGNGRSPFILNPVQRGAYTVDYTIASPRIKVGRDVLPWWPARGVYLLIEKGTGPMADLTDHPGVAGIWRAEAFTTEYSDAPSGQQLIYCFLDGDPAETARSLKPILEARWVKNGIKPLLAAPFYCIVPYEWDRYLP